MKSKRLKEHLLFFFFLAFAGATLVTGVLIEQVPETLFNATLV